MRQLAASVKVAVRPGIVVVSFGLDPIYTFDGEGRLQTAFVAGRTYQRALDGRVLEKRPPAGPSGGPWDRPRRWLSAGAALTLLDGIYTHVRGHLPAVASALAASPYLAPPGWLSAVTSWDACRLAAERDRFREVYVPVGILPPDQYRAVVLQAALGCPWNRCTFCTLYRGQPFAVRSVAEFREHIEGVRSLFGAALRSRRWLFVGEGDALSVPTKRLSELLAEALAAFPVAPADLGWHDAQRWLMERDEGYIGFSGFVDAASGARRSAADYAQLRALGLRRAHVGLETGHQPLYAELHKPGSVDAARATVDALHAAGISASVIVLVGVGGQQFAAAHVRDTLATVAAMGLGSDDMVYLSILRIAPGSAYDRWARDEGIEPLSEAACQGQYQALTHGIRRPGGPHVSAYDIEEFIY
jgi:hypothetical protein